MNTEALLWLALAGLAGWNLKLQWWVAGHNSRCHTAPAERIAKLEARMDAAEEQHARLAKNAHDDRNAVAPMFLWVQIIKEKLGI